MHFIQLSTNKCLRLLKFPTAFLGLSRYQKFYFIPPIARTSKRSLVHDPFCRKTLLQPHSLNLEAPNSKFSEKPFTPISFMMDDTTLKQFEALNLSSHQKLSHSKATYNTESDDGGVALGAQTASLPPQAVNGDNVSTPTDTHRHPLVRPSRRRLKTRNSNTTSIAQEKTPNVSNEQSGQNPIFPQQPSNPLQHLSSPGRMSSHGMMTRSQLRQYNSDASCVVSQRSCVKGAQSKTELLPYSQKITLSVNHDWDLLPRFINMCLRYTKAVGGNFTLPVRSRDPSDSLSQVPEALSSPKPVFQSRDRKSRNEKRQQVAHKFQNSDELIHLPAPEPTEPYLAKANAPVSRLSSPQRLLLVLDLNGTLLFRTTRSTQYIPRPGLKAFLDYCFAKHSVLVWSSARPHNVSGVCKKVFKPAQQKLLLAQWGRDTLGLTAEQYQQRVQVYKHLDIIWRNAEIQSRHPGFAEGGRWGQGNTILIDDSILKAAAQPFNLVQVPEFAKSDDPVEAAQEVLEQVKSKLEEFSAWDNVSASIRAQQAGEINRTEQGE